MTAEQETVCVWLALTESRFQESRKRNQTTEHKMLNEFGRTIRQKLEFKVRMENIEMKCLDKHLPKTSFDDKRKVGQKLRQK